MSLLYVLSLLIVGGLLLSPFALLARRFLPGLAGGSLLLVLVASAALYFVEHLFMFPAPMLWLLWLGLAAAGLGYNQDVFTRPQQSLRLGMPPWALVAMAICLLWPLAWRLVFPSLYASSEKLTNLLFVQNFLYAESLPAVDRWLPPYKFNFYYPLQYYMISLPGRMLNLPPALLYQSGIVLFIAMTLFAAYRLAWTITASARKATLVALVLGVGGTGAALVSVPWHYQTHWNDGQNAAFVSLTAEARFNGQVFHKIFGEDAGPKSEVLPQEQPLEYFAYQIFLGDFHPTLSSFFLVFVLLGLIYRLSPTEPARSPPMDLALLGGLPMIMLACNSWLFPHAVIVGGSWLLWRHALERDNQAFAQRFGWMLVGAVGSLLVFLPHLQGLASRSFSIGVNLVPMEYRGSVIPYLLQFWPLYLLCGLALVLGRLRTAAAFVAGMTFVLLAFNALVYVNDLSVNVYERTNSALKWWSWTWTFGLFGTLPVLLTRTQAWTRRLSYGIATLLLIPVIPMLNQLALHSGDDVGKVFGDHVYMRDHANKSIIQYLREQPQGLALENVKANAYDDSGALALLGHQAVYLGWPDHEYTWRGGFGEVAARKEPINSLYAGTLEHAADWARGQDLDYIIWSGRDCRESGGLSGFQKVDRTLTEAYHFSRTEYWGDCPVGVWRPRN